MSLIFCQSWCTDVTLYLSYHPSNVTLVRISEVGKISQYHFFFRCHLSITMSLPVFKYHRVTKLLLTVVRKKTIWHRSVSMATRLASPLSMRSLLGGSAMCNVRIWPCRTYRVKTPDLLEGGQRWMLHVSTSHNKT